MEDMSDIERLVAIEAIKRLKARRDRAVDMKDWATYEALHAPDHVSHNDGFPRYEGAALMVANVRRVMEHLESVHHSHTPDIEFQSPTHATAIWGMEDNLYWMQGDEHHWLRGFGFYHESYEKRDGAWVFTSRRLQRTRVDTSPGAWTPVERAAAWEAAGS